MIRRNDAIRVAYQAWLELDDLDDVPQMVWLPVGDDAILVGYNEAMVQFTHGGIHTALGVSMRELSGADLTARLLHVARTGHADIVESVRRLRTAPGKYRVVTLYWPRDDGTVQLFPYPLERLPERERERERENKKE